MNSACRTCNPVLWGLAAVGTVIVLVVAGCALHEERENAMTTNAAAASSADGTSLPTLADGAACKLSPAELAARRKELIPGLFTRADRVEDIDGGLRFHFTGTPGLLADLARVMEREHDCCSFLRMRLTMEAGEGPVTFEVTGPEGTGRMLRSL